MKRRIDKNKVYAFIGKAVVYTSLYLGSVAAIIWAFTRITVYK